MTMSRISVSTMTITPEEAGKMLSKNVKNRKLDQRIVDMIAKDIADGNWKMNGDTIKMNGDRLLDGQHRLCAIIKANRPVEAVVVHGISSDAFATIDTNRKKRNTQQVLELAGEDNTTTLAAAIRVVQDVTENPSKWKRSSMLLSQQYFVDFLEANPDIRHSVDFCCNLRHLKNLVGCSIPAGMHYMFSRIDGEAADRFMNDLNSGTGLSEFDPIHVLRQRLIDHGATRRRTERTVLMAYFIKAWNFRYQGQQIKRLLWKPEVEDFPVIATAGVAQLA